MSPKSLNELDFKPDQLPTAGQSLDDLPTFGSFAPPPQPGPFRFKLPAVLDGCYELYDAPTKTPPQRLRVLFDQDHPLLITQSLNQKYNGEPFQTRLSNEERGRGKDKSVVASDFDYLLRALKETVKPANNKAYAETLKKHAAGEFGADIRYSWKCSKDRNIRVATVDPATTQRTGVQEVENQKGCDSAYYQEDVPRHPDGTVPYELTCQCGALLRAFANLDNFRV